MPVSTSLLEEGVVIPPTHILCGGQLQHEVLHTLIGLEGAATLSPTQLSAKGDFSAQISANQIGVSRLTQLIDRYGLAVFQGMVRGLNDYAHGLAVESLKSIPCGSYGFTDYLDDDGAGNRHIPIQVLLQVKPGEIDLDFSGTASQVAGNVNCPLSVAAAAVFYCLRCLMPERMPVCAGAFRCISLKAEPGCLLNAEYPAAVAAGNVETSSRVVDVILGALAQAIPEQIPAASQGTMNNLAMGGVAADTGSWDYYETMAGGMGASASGEGLSAVQTHMTNTLNTPVESLESHYPIQVLRYQVRTQSGGSGHFRGGNGIVRELVFEQPATVTLLTERRDSKPWGLQGGGMASSGNNYLNDERLPAKVCIQVKPGDRLCVETPGGGGWGMEKQ